MQLISYNIFDSNWSKIKECLSLHYADKRDIRTLEHQLHRLNQRGMKVDEFYAKVNHQFSLILNKIKTESYSEETVRVLRDLSQQSIGCFYSGSQWRHVPYVAYTASKNFT